jgi:hypothetical protein
VLAGATSTGDGGLSGVNNRIRVVLAAIAAFVLAPAPVAAAPGGTVRCASEAGARKHCPADTSKGVALMATTGADPCLLGKTWGYDNAGIWVSEGCAGEFQLGMDAAGVVEVPPPDAAADPKDERKPAPRIESWGEFEPGDGFLIGRNSSGELSISAYALIRYVNQLPADQTFTDHLGNPHDVDTRQDIYPHRVLVFLKGWVGDPKFIYNIFVWTVNTTDQDALFVSLGYQFGRKFSLYGGLNGLPGTRSLQGSHPLWLGHDRVMADEFFRPYFAYGVWAQGEIVPGLWYNSQVGNSSSALGIKAVQLDRKLSHGTSFMWMPTTKEFGPKGAYGDWEYHEKVATRFGISSAFSPEERFTDADTGATGNTTIRLADSLNVFDTGALAAGVTVQNVDYRIVSVDAGMKYRGFFLQTELYSRRLDDFVSDGPLPVATIDDYGFYVQTAFYPIPKKLEIYAATSWIFGDEDAGFDNSFEYILGMNLYPFNTRNHRLNVQVIDVHDSPVSSTFGYYVGGQNGTTVSAAVSIVF